ncbi:hypothetical protein WDX82_005140 [Salmonella enterica]
MNAEKTKDWTIPITIAGGLLGLVCMVVFGSLNHTTTKNSVPAGTFISSQFYPGQSSPTYVVASPQGIGLAAPVGGDKPDRTFVLTDKGYFMVRGTFLSNKGQELEVKTAIDKTRFLCLSNHADDCFELEYSALANAHP